MFKTVLLLTMSFSLQAMQDKATQTEFCNGKTAEALNELGLKHIRLGVSIGNQSIKDAHFNKAETYFLEAANAGDAAAHNNLGNLNSERSRTVKAELKAQKKANPQSTACLKERSKLIELLSKAEFWFEKAVSQNPRGVNHLIHYNVAQIYWRKAKLSSPEGFKEYSDKAIDSFLKSGNGGYVQALIDAALLLEKKSYLESDPVEKERLLEQAIKTLNSAAMQGCDGALYNLGVIYTKQADKEFDAAARLKLVQKARDCLTDAAHKGNVRAQTNLAALYLKEYSNTADAKDKAYLVDQALEWSLLAAKRGVALALSNAGSAYMIKAHNVGSNSEKERLFASATECFEKAILQGEFIAYFNLARTYEFRSEQTSDRAKKRNYLEQALLSYEKAAALGEPFAKLYGDSLKKRAACISCGKIAMKQCSCHLARYCSEKCQTSHWSEHKRDCTVAKK